MLGGGEDTRKSKSIHLGSVDLKPGNYTHTTENRHNGIQKRTAVNVTNRANVLEAIRTTGK